MMTVRSLQVTLVLLFSSVYPMHRSLPLRSFTTNSEVTVELEDVLRAKSLGIKLVRVCRSSDLQGGAKRIHVTRLLSKPINLEVFDRQGTALMWASFWGLSDIVDLLLKSGASLYTTSELGYTPLHAAAQAGHLTIAKVLVKKGISIDSSAQCGSTPLHLAAQKGRDNLVEYLLSLGAQLELRDLQGRTPLHLAAWQGHIRIVEALLGAQANVHDKALGGYTALHAAAFGQTQGVVELLLRAKADIFVKTDGGESILVCASQRKKNVLLPYLEGLLKQREHTDNKEQARQEVSAVPAAWVCLAALNL